MATTLCERAAAGLSLPFLMDEAADLPFGLPADVLAELLACLRAQDLCALAQSCRALHSCIGAAAGVWHTLCVSSSVEPSAIGSDPRACLIHHLLWHGPVACRHTLRGHTQWVVSLAAVQDAVFSGSDDGTIRKWDASTGSSLGGFVAHHMPVTALAASSGVPPLAPPAGGRRGGRVLTPPQDDAWLASGSGELRIKLWRSSCPSESPHATWHPSNRDGSMRSASRGGGGGDERGDGVEIFERNLVISLVQWTWRAWQRLPFTPQRLCQRLLQAWESTPLVVHSWWRGARPPTQFPIPHRMSSATRFPDRRGERHLLCDDRLPQIFISCHHGGSSFKTPRTTAQRTWERTQRTPLSHSLATWPSTATATRCGCVAWGSNRWRGR